MVIRRDFQGFGTDPHRTVLKTVENKISHNSFEYKRLNHHTVEITELYENDAGFYSWPCRDLEPDRATKSWPILASHASLFFGDVLGVLSEFRSIRFQRPSVRLVLEQFGDVENLLCGVEPFTRWLLLDFDIVIFF